MREAVIVLPSGWDRAHQPHPLPLVISPHGRNNFGWANAAHYWQNLPADGPFALVCPDGLSRAHDKASDPLDQPAHDPSLFTYGYRRWIDDLARMPKIVQATLPWLQHRPRADLCPGKQHGRAGDAAAGRPLPGPALGWHGPARRRGRLRLDL